ncbi:MAG: 4Fe-4S binding protein [Nitrospirota bacterium]
MKLKLLRRLSQGATLLMIVLIPLLNIRGITAITGSLYSFAVGPLWITDPLSGVQTVMASLSADRVLLLSMLLPLLLALVFGRVFCSWMCPQNTISEIVDCFSRRGRIRRILTLPPTAVPRYAVMVCLLIAAPLIGFPAANLISAPGIISVQISKYFYEEVVGWELALIGIIVLAEMFIARRVWCNYICPVGGFLGLFRMRSTMKVVFSEDAVHVCGRCLECAEACQLGLNPMGEQIYPLCHNCGECIAACEKMKGKGKPLSFKF